MSRVRTQATVQIYEVDGADAKIAEAPRLKLESHWNDGGRVVLHVGDGTITVVIKDLEAALAAIRAGGGS